MSNKTISQIRFDEISQTIHAFSQKMIDETGDQRQWKIPKSPSDINQVSDLSAWLLDPTKSFNHGGSTKQFAWETILLCFVCASMNKETADSFAHHLANPLLRHAQVNQSQDVVISTAYMKIDTAIKSVHAGDMKSAGEILFDVAWAISQPHRTRLNFDLIDTLPQFLARIVLLAGKPTGRDGQTLWEMYRDGDIEQYGYLNNQSPYRTYIDEWDKTLDGWMVKVLKSELPMWRVHHHVVKSRQFFQFVDSIDPNLATYTTSE